MVSAAMRGFNHLMPMGCKQGKGFESSFQTSWLAPTWAFRYEARRDGVAKQCNQATLFSHIDYGFVELRLPLSQGLDTGFEADSARGCLHLIGRFKHQQANRVVCDEVHQDLLPDQSRCPATQHIHTHRRLDVPEEQFNIPTLDIQVSQGTVRRSNDRLARHSGAQTSRACQ